VSRKRPTFSKAVAPPRDLCYNQQKRISFSESIDVIDHIFFFFSVGGFTQEDTHWNASNMIYGDEPQQIGEYEDPLGASRYVYATQVMGEYWFIIYLIMALRKFHFLQSKTSFCNMDIFQLCYM
jgi:hypothetical protein